mgnify:CR=1 FL=1
MKILDNWILSRYEKIKDRIDKRESECNLKLSESAVNKLLIEHLNNLREEIKLTIQPPKWKIGKELYLKVYDSQDSNLAQIGKWDGGSLTLINLISIEQRITIPTVVVKDNILDFSLFENLAEDFIYYKATEIEAKNYELFKTHLAQYVSKFYKRNEEVCKNFGVYYCVYFKPKSFDFSPYWGLSEYSWLDPECEIAQRTKEVWERVQSVNLDIVKYKEKIKNLEFLVNNLQKQMNK